MNEHALIDRAVKAKGILESDVYQGSYDDCRAAIIALIEKTPLSDTQTAEDLRRCLKLLRDVRANLQAYMEKGKIASFRLSEIEERKKNPLRGIFGPKRSA